MPIMRRRSLCCSWGVSRSLALELEQLCCLCSSQNEVHRCPISCEQFCCSFQGCITRLRCYLNGCNHWQRFRLQRTYWRDYEQEYYVVNRSGLQRYGVTHG